MEPRHLYIYEAVSAVRKHCSAPPFLLSSNRPLMAVSLSSGSTWVHTARPLFLCSTGMCELTPDFQVLTDLGRLLLPCSLRSMAHTPRCAQASEAPPSRVPFIPRGL